MTLTPAATLSVEVVVVKLGINQSAKEASLIFGFIFSSTIELTNNS